MFVIRYQKLFLGISLVMMAASLGAVLMLGLKPAIDFTGGTLIEVSRGSLETTELERVVGDVSGVSVSVRPSDDSFIARTRTLSPEEIGMIDTNIAALEKGAGIVRTSTVGPALGEELFQKALVALGLVSLGIIIFVAIAFWRVSKPVSSWVYGFVTLGTLVHDVVIPAGVFALLGFFLNVEVDALFVVALLTVLGYSVNDTIVVMDRVRENLRMNQDKNIHEDFERTVGKSLTQTYARSINTSLTTMLVLLALFFFGGSQTEDFALALLIGVAAGAYSSIFFAAPLLAMIEKWGRKKKV